MQAYSAVASHDAEVYANEYHELREFVQLIKKICPPSVLTAELPAAFSFFMLQAEGVKSSHLAGIRNHIHFEL